MKHELEKSPAKKGRCPHCGKAGKWRYFKGYHGDERYGICDRVNNCPSAGNIYYPDGHNTNNKPLLERREAKRKQIFLDRDECIEAINNQTSNFHKFCFKLGISSMHLKKWGVGTQDGKTVFFYINGDKKFVNRKIGKYGINGKRQTAFYSLKQPSNKKFFYTQCLYGEHLLSKKTVYVEEGEKNAVIMSWFYPKYDWVSAGSSNGLSDGSEGTNNRIGPLIGKNVIWLANSDKAGRCNSSIKNLIKYGINFTVLDLFPTRNDGYDCVDAMLDGETKLIY